MKYTVTLKDGKKIVVDEGKTPQSETEAAMLNGTPVRLDGIPVSGTMIAYVERGAQTGEYGPHLAQRSVGEGDFEKAAALIEARRDPAKTEEIKDRIRETLRDIDPAATGKREYLEAVGRKRAGLLTVETPYLDQYYREREEREETVEEEEVTV